MFRALTVASVANAVGQDVSPGQDVMLTLPAGVWRWVDHVAKGVDLTKGTLGASAHAGSPIFQWTFDLNKDFYWAGETLRLPDHLSSELVPYCNWLHVSGVAAGASFTEHMKNQARSSGAGVEGTLPIGIPELGIADGDLTGSMSFGASRSSAEYTKNFKAGKTVASASRVRANVFQTVLDPWSMSDAAFSGGFKHFVNQFAADPTKEKAEKVWDNYGTHIIKSAVFGGEARREMFFDSKIDASAADNFRQSNEDDSFHFLWMSGEQKSSSDETAISSDGSECAVSISATEIVGGDVHASSYAGFCESVLNHTGEPIVMDYVALTPVWELFYLIGVEDSVGDKMKAHYLNITDAGRQCGTDSCQFPHSICTYYGGTRTWSTPCLNSDPEPYIKLFTDGNLDHLDTIVEGDGYYHGTCATCEGKYKWGNIHSAIVGPGTVAVLSDTFGSDDHQPTAFYPGPHKNLEWGPHAISLKYQYFKQNYSQDAQVEAEGKAFVV